MKLRWFVLLIASIGLRETPAAVGIDDLLVPIDLRPLVDAARSECTRLDIGTIASVFDGDAETLARTPSVNPMRVTLELLRPTTARGMALRASEDRHEVRVDVRLDGVWRTVVETEFPGDGRRHEIAFEREVTGEAWRLTLIRRAGDDYVHLYEWELLERGEAGALTITPREGRDSITGISGDALPADLCHPARLRLRALMSWPDRPTRDVSEVCRWSTSSEGFLKEAGGPGWFESQRPGAATVLAEFHGQEARFGVVLGERELRNTAPDLDVALLERRPRYPFDAALTGPKSGEPVEFVARVLWWGEQDVEDVEYQFTLDGEIVSAGAIPAIRGGGMPTRAEVSWRWEFSPERHHVGFAIDPGERVDELTEDNNRIVDATDALEVGFWVDQAVYDFVHEHRHRVVGVGNSFEDWAQHLIRRWNALFEAAVFPSTPEGVLDRVRLGRLVVVPTDALPLAGGIPTNNPDLSDHTVDLMWGFPSRDLRSGGWTLEEDGWLREDLGVLHELGHARFLIDAYGFDVHAHSVHLTGPEGERVAGTAAMPGEIVHRREHDGLMGSAYTHLSEYDALCWNLKSGRRPEASACNAPPDIGVFLQDRPRHNRFVFVDAASGEPLAGARLRVFRAQGRGLVWYGKQYDDVPDWEGTLDEAGTVVFERGELFGERIVHGFGHSNGVVILHLCLEGRHAWLFQEVTDLNLRWMSGEREEARYLREVGLDARGTPRRDGFESEVFELSLESRN